MVHSAFIIYLIFWTQNVWWISKTRKREQFWWIIKLVRQWRTGLHFVLTVTVLLDFKIVFYCWLLLLPFFSSSSELITDNQIEIGQLKAELKDKVMYTLLRKHRHQTKKSNLRSLADIGKTVSSASRLFSNQENGNTVASLVQSLFFLMKCSKKDKICPFIYFFVTSS